MHSSSSSSTNWFSSPSYLGVTGGGSGFAVAGSPSAKSCCFTERMSAKSAANSSPSSKATGSIEWLSIITTSCIASPTNRSRVIES